PQKKQWMNTMSKKALQYLWLVVVFGIFGASIVYPVGTVLYRHVHISQCLNFGPIFFIVLVYLLGFRVLCYTPLVYNPRCYAKMGAALGAIVGALFGFMSALQQCEEQIGDHFAKEARNNVVLMSILQFAAIATVLALVIYII